MSQVGAPLIERTDAIELSHRGMPETAQLRKDKPHPMAPLPASLQFIQGSSEDGGLRDHEAVQVEGISIRHLRPPFDAARSAPLCAPPLFYPGHRNHSADPALGNMALKTGPPSCSLICGLMYPASCSPVQDWGGAHEDRSVVGYIEGFAVGPDLRNIIALEVVFAPPM